MRTIDDVLTEIKQKPREWTKTPYVRAIYGRSDNSLFACPITCGIYGCAPECAYDYREVADDIGLSELDACRIVAAADNDKSSANFEPAIRARLLEACGLEPD